MSENPTNVIVENLKSVCCIVQCALNPELVPLFLSDKHLWLLFTFTNMLLKLVGSFLFLITVFIKFLLPRNLSLANYRI